MTKCVSGKIWCVKYFPSPAHTWKQCLNPWSADKAVVIYTWVIHGNPTYRVSVSMTNKSACSDLILNY